jgi:hypothetical protein
MDCGRKFKTFQDAIDLLVENCSKLEDFLCFKDKVDYEEDFNQLEVLKFLIGYMRSKPQEAIKENTPASSEDNEGDKLFKFFKGKDVNISSDGTVKKTPYGSHGMDFL